MRQKRSFQQWAYDYLNELVFGGLFSTIVLVMVYGLSF